MKLLLKEFGTRKLSWELLQAVPGKGVTLQVNLKNAIRDASSGEEHGLLLIGEFVVSGEGAESSLGKPEDSGLPAGKPIYFRITGECAAYFHVGDVDNAVLLSFAKDDNTMNLLTMHIQPLITDVINEALRRMGINSVKAQPWLQGVEFEWSPDAVSA